MSAEPIWLQCARKELQGPPRIKDYSQSTSSKATVDDTPWSSDYLCWVLEICGYKTPRSSSSRSFLNYGKRLAVPRVGAIGVFQQGKDMWNAVCGFVIGVSVKHITMISCNEVRSFDKKKLLGLRWPE